MKTDLYKVCLTKLINDEHFDQQTAVDWCKIMNQIGKCHSYEKCYVQIRSIKSRIKAIEEHPDKPMIRHTGKYLRTSIYTHLTGLRLKYIAKTKP